MEELYRKQIDENTRGISLVNELASNNKAELSSCKRVIGELDFYRITTENELKTKQEHTNK